MNKPKKIVLALGSNVGNRRENLVRAVAEIESFANVIARSHIYETEPSGYADQRDFLNAALLCETVFEPFELLEFCKKAESKLGRTPTFSNGPREIDIDIIFYEGARIASDVLEIPHPRWRERDFVLSPLFDILDSAAASFDFCDALDGVLASARKKYAPFSSF